MVVVDPDFPLGDDNLLFDGIFAENCMEMIEIGSEGDEHP